MYEEILAYEKYLLSFGLVKRPLMPKFDVSAYTDNEYLSTIRTVTNEFDCIDDEYLTINYIKGE